MVTLSINIDFQSSNKDGLLTVGQKFRFEITIMFYNRKKYNNDSTKVVFLTVSDDNKWIKASELNFLFTHNFFYVQENLGGHSDVMFGSDFSSQSVAPEHHIGFDLSVLATSDHSIITYGRTSLPREREPL